ncbi:DUF4160 domain-containing protein [Prochlorothrix hollandica]|uniref:DUF4160 domain-containing protein n=1 Tax=Prochlorothrix hollandica PCC 9006 = CALU 1027 TaxID=317619 RepID=A0A0M2PWN1_PROHO|nr:DUF4160 domain-containing protein [Prochlorothrix hollandica]KKJ00821.1 hypothetical protein PROH_06175 [Prochlorothrix hollandica PCC 9006 = CALU 1027]
MPTILRKDGFRIVIYFDDHLPCHVHAISGDSETKINLGDRAHPPTIVEHRGKRSSALKALQLVVEHQNELITAWEEIHGSL